MRAKILGLFAIGLLCLLTFTPLYSIGWGLVYIKEFNVINSEAVCGDKLCKKVDETRSQKGLSTRDFKVCGYEACKYLHRAERTIPKNINTPVGKYEFGIPLHQITCNEGLELILKSSDSSPVCIKAENAKKLIAKGWALDPESQKLIIAESQKKESTKITLYRYETNDLLGASFDKVYEQEFVIFEGIGWHGLHNVEVTISNEDKIIDSIRSKTTEHGRLWVHWPIPESLPSGQYYIHASDGIHQSELVIQISDKHTLDFVSQNSTINGMQ
jgi:hypothetical protein